MWIARSRQDRSGNKGDGDSVRHFAAIFFGKYAARHVCGARKRKIEQAQDPGDLVNHIFRYVATGEHPVKAPVHEFVCVETLVRPAIQKGLPVYILGSAVGCWLTNPLTLAVMSVAAHPGIDLRNLANDALWHP